MSIEIRQEVITPEAAKMLLESNFNGQRSIIKSRVDAYARDMRDGRWDEDVVAPITISTDGALLDGQHRLNAIVSAGVSIKCWVAYGLDESSFDYIDAGKPRTARSFLAGMPNRTTLVALATRALCLSKGATLTAALSGHYPNSEMALKASADRKETVCRPTRVEIVSYAKEHFEELSPYVSMASSLRKLFGGGSETAFGFALYLIGGRGNDPQPFLDDMHLLQPVSPASSLTVRTVQKSLTAQARPTRDYLVGCILMGWEGFAGLRETKVLMRHPENILKTRNDYYAPFLKREKPNEAR